MVPRMLSSLISYEVEQSGLSETQRQLILKRRKERKYFHSKNERRHPIPQLVFSQKKTEAGESANNMSNFTLLYPSHTLANVFDPQEALIGQHSRWRTYGRMSLPRSTG